MVQAKKFAEFLSQVCHIETVIGPKEPHLDSLKDLHLLVMTLYLAHSLCNIFVHINPFDFYFVRVLIENGLLIKFFRCRDRLFVWNEMLYQSAKRMSVAKLFLSDQRFPVAIVSKRL